MNDLSDLYQDDYIYLNEMIYEYMYSNNHTENIYDEINKHINKLSLFRMNGIAFIAIDGKLDYDMKLALFNNKYSNIDVFQIDYNGNKSQVRFKHIKTLKSHIDLIKYIKMVRLLK